MSSKYYSTTTAQQVQEPYELCFSRDYSDSRILLTPKAERSIVMSQRKGKLVLDIEIALGTAPPTKQSPARTTSVPVQRPARTSFVPERNNIASDRAKVKGPPPVPRAYITCHWPVRWRAVACGGAAGRRAVALGRSGGVGCRSRAAAADLRRACIHACNPNLVNVIDLLVQSASAAV